MGKINVAEALKNLEDGIHVARQAIVQAEEFFVSRHPNLKPCEVGQIIGLAFADAGIDFASVSVGIPVHKDETLVADIKKSVSEQILAKAAVFDAKRVVEEVFALSL